MRVRFLGTLITICLCLSAAGADELWTRNQKGRDLLKKNDFVAALREFDAAAKIAPQDPKIIANRSSALYGLKKYDEAAQGFETAAQCPDSAVSNRAHFNAGDAYYKLGEKLSQSSDPQETPKAQEAFKKAAGNFTDVLKKNRSDRDAKWNLEMSVKRLREMEEKQKQQDKDNKDKKKDDKNKDDKNKDQDKKDQGDKDKKDESDKKDQDKKDQDKKNDDDQKKQDQSENDKKDDQKKDPQDKQPQPQPKPNEQEKQAAQQLLMQYADDGKDLNKPPKKAKAAVMGRPEKDW